MLEETGRADPGIGYIFASTFCALVPIVIEPHVNEELCAELAPIFCDTKEAKVCSLILPTLGNIDGRNEDDFYGLTAQATAKIEGEEVVINGYNMRPINSGGTANLFGVICDTKDGLLYVLVPADINGVKRGENFLKTGLNADKNANVSFDNVRVPKKYVV